MRSQASLVPLPQAPVLSSNQESPADAARCPNDVIAGGKTVKAEVNGIATMKIVDGRTEGIGYVNLEASADWHSRIVARINESDVSDLRTIA